MSAHQMHAKVFFSGNLCELSEFEEPSGTKGHLHILRDGELEVIDQSGTTIHLTPPCLLFFPQGKLHRLVPDPQKGADLVCATIEYLTLTKNNVQQHPILAALPAFVSFQLTADKTKQFDVPHNDVTHTPQGLYSHTHHNRPQNAQRLQTTINTNSALVHTANWIFKEAFESSNGKQIMLDKLCDIFVLQILREVIDHTNVTQGMLAGLSHPQLSLALLAIHKQAEHPWQVASLADIALMSRAKFAKLFVTVVGQTPLDYVTEWRIQKAQNLLLQHQPVNIVAIKVGYDSGSALARVFKSKLGLSPKAWLRQAQALLNNKALNEIS